MTSDHFETASKGIIFVLSAPAGTGKTTLVKMLTDEFSNIKKSTSCTTRMPRPREKDGVDYFYIDRQTFEKKISEGDFLEYAKVFEHYYGTSKSFVEHELASGHHIFLVIDTQGAKQLMKKIQGVFIFVAPPSRQEQEARLRKRGAESDEMIQERLLWAENEIAQAVHYDYQIINRDLKTAYEELKKIVLDEEKKHEKFNEWRDHKKIEKFIWFG